MCSDVHLDGSFQCFLDIEPLAHDGLVQLPLESQQIHVGLRFGDQLSDLCSGKTRLRSS